MLPNETLREAGLASACVAGTQALLAGGRPFSACGLQPNQGVLAGGVKADFGPCAAWQRCGGLAVGRLADQREAGRRVGWRLGCDGSIAGAAACWAGWMVLEVGSRWRCPVAEVSKGGMSRANAAQWAQLTERNGAGRVRLVYGSAGRPNAATGAIASLVKSDDRSDERCAALAEEAK